MNKMRVLVAAMLAALPAVSFANLSLENAAFVSGSAVTADNPEAARNLAFKALEGGFKSPEAGAVGAAGHASPSAVGAVIGERTAKRMRGEPPAPSSVKDAPGGLGAFLKDESGSVRGTDAAILLAMIFVAALVVPAAAGFIVAKGIGLGIGAAPATAKLIGYAGAVVGAKLGLDWFRR